MGIFQLVSLHYYSEGEGRCVKFYRGFIIRTKIGDVAQWLGRRSVAGGLSLIYAWSMVDVWPLCG